MFHGHLDYFQKPPFGGRSNIETGRPWHSKISQPLIYLILSCVRTRMNGKSLKLHLVEGHGHIRLYTTLDDPWPHYMILEVCWNGLWTLSFGLSQFHGRGSWLMCEVGLTLFRVTIIVTKVGGDIRRSTPWRNYCSANKTNQNKNKTKTKQKKLFSFGTALPLTHAPHHALHKNQQRWPSFDGICPLVISRQMPRK
jgi:hypothetical protein